MADEELALAQKRNTTRLRSQFNLWVFLRLESGRAPEDMRAGVAGNPIINACPELLGTEQNDAFRATAFTDLPEMPGEGPRSTVLGCKLVQLVREENDGTAARARIFPLSSGLGGCGSRKAEMMSPTTNACR